MSSENIIFAIICWVCALIFGAISIWAFKRKDPMHFWSGSTVRPEEITDIPAYNRANGLMWAVYTALIVLTGIMSLFSIKIGVILLVIFCVPGTLGLIFAYKWIYNKYRNTAVARQKVDHAAAKTSRKHSAIIVAISIIFVGALFLYGEREPGVIVSADHIQIKGMYGVTIDFTEISEIALLEQSARELGVGRRTNGYGGIAGALKGNFSSDTLGKTLLFVQSKSSPTIKIGRPNARDVYISFRNSKSTEQLYQALIANAGQ